MFAPLKSPDLIVRVLVIALTSVIVAFVTRSTTYDLHFKMRKPQRVSAKVQIIEVTNPSEVQNLIQELEQSQAKIILSRETSLLRGQKSVRTYFINSQRSQQLSLNIIPSDDGIVREVEFTSNPFKKDLVLEESTPLTLNFRGKSGTFESVTDTDWKIYHEALEDHWIILKWPKDRNSYTTPLGPLDETEILATALDNAFENRFIPAPSVTLHLVILTSLLVAMLLILLTLPSTLALVATFLVATLYLSLSLWIFDTFAIWMPLLSPLVQIIMSLLLISNYKSILNERTRWALEKETLLFQAVEEMKTNFLSLFSHDLKTPLAKIIGLTDLVSQKVEDTEIKAELEKINSASRELERYIKRILKMSQVQSKNMSIEVAPVDINQLIEKSLQQNNFLAQQKKIEFQKNLQPLFMVEMDGSLIQEVLINFIENAITYSPANSTVTVRSEESNEFVKVSVIDQGKGIPEKAQDSIWEKYYRFDNDSAGYGLGLYLSRYVIQLHGGKVFLKSKEGQGCEFGFILPIQSQLKENS